MSLTVQCPHCGHTRSGIRDAYAGKKAECAKCHDTFRIPALAAASVRHSNGSSRNGNGFHFEDATTTESAESTPRFRSVNRRFCIAAGAVLGVVLLGLLLANILQPSKQPAASNAASEGKKSLAFDPEDIERTWQWVDTAIHQPIIAAMKRGNPWDIDKVRQEAASQLAALKGKEIRWTITVSGLDHTHAYVQYDWQCFHQRVHSSRLILEYHPRGEWSEQLGKLHIGESLALEDAKRLRSGQRVIVSGILAAPTLESSHEGWHQTFMPIHFVRATLPAHP